MSKTETNVTPKSAPWGPERANDQLTPESSDGR